MPTRDVDEIQLKAKGYIYLEEMQKAIANLGKNQADRKSSHQQEERPRKEMWTRMVWRYHDYKPIFQDCVNKCSMFTMFLTLDIKLWPIFQDCMNKSSMFTKFPPSDIKWWLIFQDCMNKFYVH